MKCRSRLDLRIGLSALTASFLAMTTKSSGASSSCLNDSRARRRKRFLSTARAATRLEIARPSRARETSLSLASTVKNRSEDRSAPAKTRANSSPAVSRCARVNAVLEAPTQRPFRLWTASGAELGPPLRAPLVEHLAPAARCHAGTKPMLALAANLARLKSSLHKLLARDGKALAKTNRCAGRSEPATLRPRSVGVNQKAASRCLWISAGASY
jgi:hypothetical protein